MEKDMVWGTLDENVLNRKGKMTVLVGIIIHSTFIFRKQVLL